MTLSLKGIEKKFYEHLYRGQTVLIKISGAEICSPAMADAMSALKWMISKDIRVVVVFGGGEQIDAQYLKNTGKTERPKIDGVAVTTKEVLEEGAIPAYEEIEKHLKKLLKDAGLWEDASIVPPSDIRAVRKSPKTGPHTGALRDLQFDMDRPLTLVGFLAGTQEKGMFCVNADEIATFFVKHYRINEIFFVTKTGGILDDEGQVVNTLGTGSIQKILTDKHPSIHATGGMKKKVREISNLLKYVSKVAVTNLAGVLDEVTKLEGHGTLCVNLAGARIELCTDDDVFHVLYSHFVAEGSWKKRTKKEYELIRSSHQVLSLSGSPLGGYSLMQRPYPVGRGKQGLAVECLWAGKERNGIGKALIEKAILESALRSMPLFLYTKQDIHKLAKGFVHYPKKKSKSGATLWVRQLG